MFLRHQQNIRCNIVKKSKLATLLAVIVILCALLLIQKHRFSVEKARLQLLAHANNSTQRALTKQEQQHMSPATVIEQLKKGNSRFVHNDLRQANYLNLVHDTATHQYPDAIVVSCIDSRVPPEIIFDQAIGDIFVSRVAGEVISPDIIAGMEYAASITGSKLIVIMGHGNCGAVTAACEHVKLGKITGLLNKIQPAVQQTEKQLPNRTCEEKEYINQIAINNVKNIVAQIPSESPVIKKLIDKGEVEIIGAMYDVNSGKVAFLD